MHHLCRPNSNVILPSPNKTRKDIQITRFVGIGLRLVNTHTHININNRFSFFSFFQRDLTSGPENIGYSWESESDDNSGEKIYSMIIQNLFTAYVLYAFRRPLHYDAVFIHS